MDKELRQMLLTLRKEREDFCQLRRELREQGNDWLPYPEHLRAIPCGATTRAGTPCKMTTIYNNGRCKLHGGKSTGAKTPEGKARQREGFRRWLERQRQATSQGDNTQ
ncbi:HGGxSTG domain-containing protein [Klebsiella michiganensis]|uniref:HGGxSTG domain-containing protein n=1 Tax=Klebsiella michiganensis TaxID=1134687 RepID=UPI001CB816C9|nr:HGGxSTG domain-containing protein [Klebsiella michiganensis]MDS7746298.1 HGGxSTG domain-containing protein [Klebsiella michiganensis]MDV1252487.1 HGGxSTG domain-containing protein [Klebsiella michiganensis]WCA37805.1 HGGxSTG domain-containing protein [Klebsiella michiganensis]